MTSHWKNPWAYAYIVAVVAFVAVVTRNLGSHTDSRALVVGVALALLVGAWAMKWRWMERSGH